MKTKDKIFKHDRWVARLEFVDIIKASKEMKGLLQETQGGSQFAFDHEAGLIKVQNQLIELGKHVLEFCDWVSDFLRENYYQILILILKRSELDLG